MSDKFYKLATQPMEVTRHYARQQLERWLKKMAEATDPLSKRVAETQVKYWEEACEQYERGEP